jgi:hypothetical protein
MLHMRAGGALVLAGDLRLNRKRLEFARPYRQTGSRSMPTQFHAAHPAGVAWLAALGLLIPTAPLLLSSATTAALIVLVTWNSSHRKAT